MYFEKFTGTFSLLQKQRWFVGKIIFSRQRRSFCKSTITGDAVMETVCFTEGTPYYGWFVNGYHRWNILDIILIAGMFILLESRLGDRCGAGIIPLIYPVWSRRYNSFPGQ
jgi:hypothetical protein